MRLLRKNGETYRFIADKYKTSPSTIYSIVKKQYYYNIPDDGDVDLKECYERLRSEAKTVELKGVIDLFWKEVNNGL